MEQLGVDLALFLSQAVNFGLLFVLLSLLLYKPVLGKLRERAERIAKGVKDAERAEDLLAESIAHRESEMEKARAEAHEVVERATRLAEQQRQEILAQARQEAHDIIARAQQQARHEIQEGEIALREQVIDLALAASSRLIEESLDDAKHRQLVTEFVAELEELQ